MAFRQDINGLRAIAVIVVVLFHFGVGGFAGGFIGVDIFFVISGYLMTSILLKSHNQNTFSFYKFYMARVKRIVPALLALCITLTLIGWFLLLPSEFKVLAKHVVTSLAFVSNIFFFLDAGYFDVASHNKLLLHTWSLSIEWQFYLLYPVIIHLMYKYWGKKYIALMLWLTVTLSFLLLIYTPTDETSAAFFLLHTRFWELAIGGLVYIYSNKKTGSTLHYYLGVLLITLSVIIIDSAHVWPAWYAFIPVLGTCLVIYAAKEDVILTNNPIFSLIGKLSYSVYLWHWPVVVILNRLDLLHDSLWIMLGIIFSFVLGWLSYLFVELPSINYFKRNGRIVSLRFRPWVLIFGVIVCTGFTGAIFLNNGFSFRVSEEVAAADNERHNGIYSETSNIILAKELVRNSDVILIGDSFATAVSDVFKEVMEGAKYTTIIKRGCPTVRDAEQRNQLRTEKCSFFTNTFLDLLNDENLKSKKKIVIINSFDYWKNDKIFFKSSKPEGFIPATDSLFIDKLVEGTCQLQQKHDVYFMLPIPTYSKDIPSLIASRLMQGKPVDNIKINLKQHKMENSLGFDSLTAANKKCNVTLLDPSRYLCSKGYCDIEQRGRPLYYDSTHLSRFGALRLKPLFEKVRDN